MKNLTNTIILILFFGISFNVYSQNKPFVPIDFKIPDLLENEYFRIRMLTIHDVIKDYDAVMTSIDHLQGAFGPNSKWPKEELTLEQDLIDLGWHQKEFQRRNSFAYTVMNLDESKCLGCVYIVPSSKSGYDAVVYLWVRKSAFDKGLDPILYETIKNWLNKEWPFKNVAYPVREIGWQDWEQME